MSSTFSIAIFNGTCFFAKLDDPCLVRRFACQKNPVIIIIIIMRIIDRVPCDSGSAAEHLQSSLRGKENNLLDLLGECGPIGAVLSFIREVNLYDKI